MYSLARKAGIESVYAMALVFFSCIDSRVRVVFEDEGVDYHVDGYSDGVGCHWSVAMLL